MGIGLFAGAVAIGVACAAFGVAIANMYPKAKSVGRWVRHGWHVALAYVVGFMVMLALMGWHPTDKRGRALVSESPPVAVKARLTES